MESDDRVQNLRNQVSITEAELNKLKAQLAQAESRLEHNRHDEDHTSSTNFEAGPGEIRPLSLQDHTRYGRQMIVRGVGLNGQLQLKQASVLIVGVGGLGCPAAAYLAGAGVGTIGLVDGDVVELSNLHRQILHGTPNVGQTKVDSAIRFLNRLNPTIRYVAHRERLSAHQAHVVRDYDLILDCTDHPTSRYLVSDLAILLGKPLVTASALGMEGQLMALNNPARPPGDSLGGPCYRCIFPRPPPAESVVSCGEGGILGPVVGVMGVLQALEAIKLITIGLVERPLSDDKNTSHLLPDPPALLIFTAESAPPFRSVRLRSRRVNCDLCSASATITLDTLRSGSLDYGLFCGLLRPVNLLLEDERISASNYNRLRRDETSTHILVDVRDKIHFDICNLKGSINIPLNELQRSDGSKPMDLLDSADWSPLTLSPNIPIYVVCRLGNDSQLAVRKLKGAGFDRGGHRYVADIRGGFKAWKEEVDHTWPDY